MKLNREPLSGSAERRLGPLHSALSMGTIVAGWLVCTVAQVEKYLPLMRAALVCLIGSLLVWVGLVLLRRRYRQGRDVELWVPVAVLLLLLGSFAAIYPKSLHHHTPSGGSDREDALRVELAAVVHHSYPYAARTFRNNPPTPLPGAMWLAAPFFFLGRVALQNLMWAVIFLLVLLRFFRFRLTAAAFLVLFLLTALENLNDFDVGGDYVTNILYVSVALLCFARATSEETSFVKTSLAIMLLGTALSSRALYVVVLPPVMAYVFQRNTTRRAVVLIAGVLLTTVLVTLPVFFPHPLVHLHAQLNQNADKLSILPHWLSGATLPVTALLVGCLGFLLPMTLQRIFLLAGTATLVLLLPPMVCFVLAEGGLRSPLTSDLEYLAVSALFLGLWAMARWEEDGLTSLH